MECIQSTLQSNMAKVLQVPSKRMALALGTSACREFVSELRGAKYDWLRSSKDDKT